MDQSDLLDGNGKNKPMTTSSFRRRYCSTTAVTLLLFVLTNTVSILVSSGAVGSSFLRRYKPATILPLWDDSAALLADLNATQAALAASRAELAGLYARVGTANELLRTLLHVHKLQLQQKLVDFDGWAREPAGELKLALGPAHGPSGTAELSFVPAVGHACRSVQDELERFMSYTPGGACPSGEALAHRLILAGCDPLPRRRCRPPSPKGYVHPLPLPASLWAMPPDTTVVWDAYHPCQNYSCLVNTTKALLPLATLPERRRWARDDGKLGYSIDAVLRTRPKGTVRIGLDIISGAASAAVGTFAARMMERGVTVVTAAGDAGGAPLGGFVASRGLVPVHVAAARRLPFFDGTLDIVHKLGGGSEWVSNSDNEVMLEFAIFDVYRVLRPGGLFWIDHFVFPSGRELNTTFAPMIDRVGFKKLRWNTGRKLYRKGNRDDEWYISALLEKPMT